jgi:hypothetical protein
LKEDCSDSSSEEEYIVNDSDSGVKVMKSHKPRKLSERKPPERKLPETKLPDSKTYWDKVRD